MSEQDYLVATIRVEKIKRVPVRDSVNRSSREPVEMKRIKGEVTHITLKAPNIETLKKKLAAHIELIDDDVEPDEHDSAVMR